MKMKKKYKIMMGIIAFLVVILMGIAWYKCFIQIGKEVEEPPVTNVTTVTNKIEGYDYTLDDRDTELFITMFKELKENLESDKIDEEAYAKSVAKLFVTDLYTINNKVSKYDIGGLEYLYTSAKDSFRAKVLDTIYKTVEDDSYKTRNQELPIVKSVEILDISKGTYTINKEKKESCEISLSWTYQKDLGYDSKGNIKMIKEENRWAIVSYEPVK